MSDVPSAHEADYVAVISPVREVMLTGTADLAYWREQLAQEELTPFDEVGAAVLSISATSSSFRGIAFREFTISVAVSTQDKPGQVGSFLIKAFNSSRLLALAERWLFRTPYYPAQIHLEVHSSITVSVGGRDSRYLEARLLGESVAARQEMQEWRGPIFLPRDKRAEVFYARLAGLTDTYPFKPDDVLTINAQVHDVGFDHLTASDFRPREWHVRHNAVHARTRTFPRN